MSRISVDKIQLLIIEDDQDQRELISETLEDYFGPGTVQGADSRAAAMAQPLESFDLILSDYNLPDATGLELLESIQQRCNTPVIMVTGENVGKIAAEAIRHGAVDYVVKIGDYLFTIPLVIEKNLTVARMIKEREQLRRQLEASNAQLEQMAATDPLTQLYNRRHFGKVVEQLFAESQRYETDLSCVMIDLDGYKQFNDRFGHQLGDQLLVIVGKGIQANLRQMDVAARYGGDEFVLLLPRAGEEEAAVVAERIRQEFARASSALMQQPVGVTMSVGIGSLQLGQPMNADALVALADKALYRAKAGGRDRIAMGTELIG
jgi:diguanylate cyclase (GGDEF)-like protein